MREVNLFRYVVYSSADAVGKLTQINELSLPNNNARVMTVGFCDGREEHKGVGFVVMSTIFVTHFPWKQDQLTA